MGYFRFSFCYQNTDHIETNRVILQSGFGQVVQGDPADLLLFLPGYRFDRRSVCRPLAGFYFNEYAAVAVSADDVDFAESAAVVAGDDLVPLFLQKGDCRFFTLFTEADPCF